MRMPAAVAFGSGHEVGDRNKIELVSVVDDDNLLMSRDDERIFLRRRNVEAITTRGDDDKLIILNFVPKWPCAAAHQTTQPITTIISFGVFYKLQIKAAESGGGRRRRRREEDANYLPSKF